MIGIIVCLVFLCLMIFCGCLFIEFKEKKRKEFLESHCNDRITLFSRKKKLKFVIENFPKKEFYIFGVCIDIENYAIFNKKIIESQGALNYYKAKLKTVKDVLDFEEQEENRIKEINDRREGNFR